MVTTDSVKKYCLIPPALAAGVFLYFHYLTPFNLYNRWIFIEQIDNLNLFLHIPLL
ncbi:hypothetical protein SAMN05444673_3608 [Bacillus sp. OV166]|nr:hypothetical protein SAMN05444673_3608 [Bacillus sp. OV166]